MLEWLCFLCSEFFSRNMQVILIWNQNRTAMSFLVWREIESGATSNDKVQTCDYSVSRKYIYFQVNNMIARLAEFLLICDLLRVLEKTRDNALYCYTSMFRSHLLYSTRLIFIFATAINLHFPFWVSVLLYQCYLLRCN